MELLYIAQRVQLILLLVPEVEQHSGSSLKTLVRNPPVVWDGGIADTLRKTFVVGLANIVVGLVHGTDTHGVRGE